MKDIIFIAGQTGSGKDTIIRQLKERMPEINFINHDIYTTRKPRDGELETSPYHFIDPNNVIELIDYNIVSKRRYGMNVNGTIEEVYYVAVDFGNKISTINNKNTKIICAGSVYMMYDFIQYYGEKNLKLFYIDAPFEVRLHRASQREISDTGTSPEIFRRVYKDWEDYIEFEKNNKALLSNAVYTIDNSKNDDYAVNKIISILNE